MELSTSDIIEIISILCSSATSIIAIIISVVSLRRNSQNIEQSTKPCITIYVDQITVCEQKSYFIVKNFGASAGIITDFEFVNPPGNLPQSLQDNFDRLPGIILAPGQSKLIPMDCCAFDVNEVYVFRISYKNGTKIYSDEYSLNIRNFTQIPTVRPQTASEPIIANSLREMIERMI